MSRPALQPLEAARTSGRRTGDGGPRLDVRATRAIDPPYDDEAAAIPTSALGVATQGALALALAAQQPSTTHRGSDSPPRPALRLIASPEADHPGDSGETGHTADPGDTGETGDTVGEGDCFDQEARAIRKPVRTPRALLPSPRAWSIRLVQVMAEVLTGTRPAAQLAPYLTTESYAALEHRVSGRGRRTGAPSLSVQSVHVSEPSDGIAEACAVIRRGPRATALALRLEGIDGRWCCTALHVG